MNRVDPRHPGRDGGARRRRRRPHRRACRDRRRRRPAPAADRRPATRRRQRAPAATPCASPAPSRSRSTRTSRRTPSSAVYIVEIFGGLLTLDPQLNVQPDLAARSRRSRTAARSSTPTARPPTRSTSAPNVTFQDRKPVTADIVKCSLERAADPATQSLVSEFFLGDIVGVKDEDRRQGRRTSAASRSSTRARSRSRSSATCRRSSTSSPTRPSFVVDPSQVGGTCGGRDYGDGDDNWTRHPNGTGPYKLDQWRLGEEIRLEANDHYQLGVAHVKNVRFLLAGGGITLVREGRHRRHRRRPGRHRARAGPGRSAQQGVPHGHAALARLHRLQHERRRRSTTRRCARRSRWPIDKNQIASGRLPRRRCPSRTSIVMPGMPVVQRRTSRRPSSTPAAREAAARGEQVRRRRRAAGDHAGRERHRRHRRRRHERDRRDVARRTSASTCRSSRPSRPRSSRTSPTAATRCFTSAGSWTTRTKRTCSTSTSTATSPNNDTFYKNPRSTICCATRSPSRTRRRATSCTSRPSRSS